jgi:hypothetical protein
MISHSAFDSWEAILSNRYIEKERFQQRPIRIACLLVMLSVYGLAHKNMIAKTTLLGFPLPVGHALLPAVACRGVYNCSKQWFSGFSTSWIPTSARWNQNTGIWARVNFENRFGKQYFRAPTAGDTLSWCSKDTVILSIPKANEIDALEISL